MNGYNLPIGMEIQKFVNKPEFTSSNHSHPYYEFLFIRRASFNYLVGERIVTPCDYSFILVDTNTVHKATADHGNNSYIIIKMYPEMVDSRIQAQVADMFRAPLLVLSREDSTRLEVLINEILRERQKKELNFEMVMQHQLNELLALMCRLSAKTEEDEEEKPLTMTEQIIAYISENLFSAQKADLSLESVAEHFHFSPCAFSRMFKREVGIGFKQYILSVKIGQAKKLLTTSDCSITEIAFRCGFTDSNYFSSVFKKFESITPTDYVKFIRSIK